MLDVPTIKIDSPVAPKIGHRDLRRVGPCPGRPLLTCDFSGVSEGIRTLDTQDHNLVL